MNSVAIHLRGMPATTRNAHTVEEHFSSSAPTVRAVYDRILKAARKWGPVEEDPKKTSIHLNRSNAFAGIATRKETLIVTLKSKSDIDSPRIWKHQRASANRWYLDVRLDTPKNVDAEFLTWLKASYDLS